MSENTKAVYNNAVRSFNQFREQHALDCIWPVPVSHVASYISYCFQNGYSPSTVTTYMSAISFVHKLRLFQDPTDSFIVKKLMEGFKRLQSCKDSRAPITEDILQKVCHSLSSVCYNQYEMALFKAVFCIAYFGLFRIGELVYTDQRQIHHALRFDDVKLKADRLIVRLRISKTHQYGNPLFLHVQSNPDKTICPVTAMHDYLKFRTSLQGNLFCHANGLPLTRYQFGAILSKSITHIGLQSRYYKSHSFRIGRATSLAMKGVSSEQIKKLGRWKSDAFSKYIRPAIN